MFRWNTGDTSGGRQDCEWFTRYIRYGWACDPGAAGPGVWTLHEIGANIFKW